MDHTWQDIATYLKRSQAVIVPLGSIEQHGPGMPLGTDTIIGENLAVELGARRGVLVAPVLTPGQSQFPHRAFPGTITLTSQTFIQVIRETLESLYRHGFRRFFLCNGHGGNEGPILSVMPDFVADHAGARISFASWWKLPEVVEAGKSEFGRPLGHGGAEEASLVMHFAPGLVKPEQFTEESPRIPGGIMVGPDLVGELVTESGLIGSNQHGAGAEIGERLAEVALEALGAKLDELLA
jgi:creatinine amidohydrolase